MFVLCRIIRNIFITKEKKVLTLNLFEKFTWRIGDGSIMTGGLGQTFQLGGDPSRMWGHKELFWGLPKFQDLG